MCVAAVWPRSSDSTTPVSPVFVQEAIHNQSLKDVKRAIEDENANPDEPDVRAAT